MAEKKKVGLQALLNVRRFLPAPTDLLRPFPPPKKGELVMQGVTADVLSFGLGFIPYVGDIVGDAVEDNIMATSCRSYPQPSCQSSESRTVFIPTVLRY